MDEEARKRFFELDKAGRRKESKLAFRQWAKSFLSEEERHVWAYEFLKEQQFFDRFGRFGIRVRQELFDEILWPYLSNGLLRQEPMCQFWLAGLEQNLFSPPYREKDTELSKLRLLRAAYEAGPVALHIQRALLISLIELFNYADHEWPWGILNGAVSADVESLAGYEELIELAQSLDARGQYAERLGEFASHVQLHRQRLSTTSKLI